MNDRTGLDSVCGRTFLRLRQTRHPLRVRRFFWPSPPLVFVMPSSNPGEADEASWRDCRVVEGPACESTPAKISVIACGVKRQPPGWLRSESGVSKVKRVPLGTAGDVEVAVRRR